MLIVYSYQNFCNINKRSLYYVLGHSSAAHSSEFKSGLWGLCHWALQGTVPCLQHCTAEPSPGERQKQRHGSYWPFRQRGKKIETVFKVPSIFQANTKWRHEINSVYFILNKMGITFEGPHKILAFLLAVWSYEMLTSVLLQRYFKSRVSRFRLNQYITEGV